MISPAPQLRIVTYHYVRDLPRTRFPQIKGILVDAFCRQVDALCARYEMATLESALAFVAGEYVPSRDLCLLTFDDGLKEHYAEVTPILAERGIEGQFFLPTLCIEEHRVVLVHQNHFLMAALGFDNYREEFLRLLGEVAPELDTSVDAALAQRTYRFDTPPVAEFKYLLNFCLSDQVRTLVLSRLFEKHLADEAEFAKELYVSWEEARAMQDAGMVLGGHSHCHKALGVMNEQDQQNDLSSCTDLLKKRVGEQPLWPFCYPYGNPANAFNAHTVDLLRELGYCCAYTTAQGANPPGSDLFRLQRFDTTDLTH